MRPTASALAPVLALAVACSLAGCRRAAPPAATPAAAPEAPPAASASPAPRPEPAPAPAALPAPAPAATPAQEPPAEATAPAASPGPAEPEEDSAVYAWEDRDGSIHYGRRADIPPDRLSRARTVDAGLAVVASEPPPPLLAPAAAPPQAAPAAQATPRREPGTEPERDAQGLPIPGTMKDTYHTDAIRRLTGVQLDPATMERQREEENRRMNCKVVDGATYCDGPR